MIRIIHTTDWHLGYTKQGQSFRWLDIKEAVEQFRDQVIELGSDNTIHAIIHTGDIFHGYHPRPAELSVAVDIFRSIIDELGWSNLEKPPIFVIRGNHDQSTRISQGKKSTLEFLEELNLIQYEDFGIISGITTINSSGQAIDLPNLDLWCVSYFGNDTARWLAKLYDNEIDQRKTNILLMHAGVTEIVDDNIDIGEIHLNDIAGKGFDYVALGHWHQEYRKPKLKIGNPGSLECTSMNEWNKEVDGFHEEKYWYEVIIDKSDNHTEIIPHQIEIRPKKKFVLEYEDDLENLIDFLHNELSDFNREEAIIHVELILDYTVEDLTQFDLDEILGDILNNVEHLSYKPITREFLKLRRVSKNLDEIKLEHISNNFGEHDPKNILELIEVITDKLSKKEQFNQEDELISESYQIVENFMEERE